jgi:hypothetical protein
MEMCRLKNRGAVVRRLLEEKYVDQWWVVPKSVLQLWVALK